MSDYTTCFYRSYAKIDLQKPIPGTVIHDLLEGLRDDTSVGYMTIPCSSMCFCQASVGMAHEAYTTTHISFLSRCNRSTLLGVVEEGGG